MKKKVAAIDCREGEIKVHVNYTHLMDPKGLIPHPQNNNQHPEEQVEVMKAVLKASGWRTPVIVSEKTGRIISGHLRVHTAIQMGLSKIPVDMQVFESNLDEVRHLTADNELARMAEFEAPKFIDFKADQERQLSTDDFQLAFFNPKDWGMMKYPKEKAEKTKKEPVIVIEEGQEWNLGSSGLITIPNLDAPNLGDYIQKFLNGFRKKSGEPVTLPDGQTWEEYLEEKGAEHGEEN